MSSRCSDLLTVSAWGGVFRACFEYFRKYMLAASESTCDQSGRLKGRRRGRSWDGQRFVQRTCCCLVGWWTRWDGVASNHMQRKHVRIGNQTRCGVGVEYVIAKHVCRRLSEALDYCEHIVL